MGGGVGGDGGSGGRMQIVKFLWASQALRVEGHFKGVGG